MLSRTIHIATRKSLLALWQAEFVRSQLLTHWPELQIALLPMSTSGDQFLKDKLLTIGGKGLFVKELEEALLDKRADLAVHSMKDVPVSFPEGLSLGVICARENPFDAFVSQNDTPFQSLPPSAVVGTSSLRRQSQLLALRPDLQVKALRGNIHSRLKKLDDGDYHAIILASAGLERMSLHARIQKQFRPEEILPACGQGALGIECRTDDAEIMQYLQPLNDAITARCVQTERRVNELLGGNCHTPLAVYCQPLEGDQLLLRAKVASADGRTVVEERQQGSMADAIKLAEQCVEKLWTGGAKALILDSQRI